MKKIIALLMICALLLCLAACGAYSSGTTSAFSDEATTEQAPTDATEPLPTEQSVHSISGSELIAYIKDFGNKNGSNSDFVSEIKREPGETASETKITFNYYNGLVSATVTEINNQVQTIMTMSLPAVYAAMYPSNTALENMQFAYIADLQLIIASDPYKNEDWHIEQMKNAPNEGDDSVTIGTYLGDGWQYTTMLSNAHVTCVAARYCDGCKTNAPKVSFSSDERLCDTCRGGQTDSQGSSQPAGNDNPAGNNNTPAGSNNTTGGGSNTTGGGSYQQQPSTCNHNYAEATCVKPKTCTLCGATIGSTTGHSWKNATCTEPATCSVCLETWGSANGHSWEFATCSTPKTCCICKATEGSALPHDMNFTKCRACDYSDFSGFTLTSNTFCRDSWIYRGYGYETQYLSDGEASINIDSNGVCTVTFDEYSYTFTLVQSEVWQNDVHFKCYMDGELVNGVEVTFYFPQNRCDFFLHGGTFGFSQVVLNFDM